MPPTKGQLDQWRDQLEAARSFEDDGMWLPPSPNTAKSLRNTASMNIQSSAYQQATVTSYYSFPGAAEDDWQQSHGGLSYSISSGSNDIRQQIVAASASNDAWQQTYGEHSYSMSNSSSDVKQEPAAAFHSNSRAASPFYTGAPVVYNSLTKRYEYQRHNPYAVHYSAANNIISTDVPAKIVATTDALSEKCPTKPVPTVKLPVVPAVNNTDVEGLAGADVNARQPQADHSPPKADKNTWYPTYSCGNIDEEGIINARKQWANRSISKTPLPPARTALERRRREQSLKFF